MKSKIPINCKNCVKDLHEECLDENCLCKINNHGVKKRDLGDSIKDMIDVLVATAPLREQANIERIKQYGRPINQIENYLNTIIKKDPTLVKQLLRVYLSAYTDNPINIALLAPSSDGKTYATVEVSKLFPKKDIILVGRLSPTALIHQNGFLIDENGNNIEDTLYDLETRIINAKGQELKELKKEKHNFLKSSRMCVDLNNKIMIFLDNPNPATYEMLKPIMSHDAKETLYMTTKGDGSLKVKQSIIRNWPSFIFCSAKNEEENIVWDEIKTRLFVTSPNSDVSKYEEANKLTSKKMSRPSWAKRTKDEIEDEKWAKFYVEALKIRLTDACKEGNNPIINVFDALLAETFPHKEGIDMRHLGRLMSFINLETLINSEYNPELLFDDIDSRTIKSIFTTVNDIDDACNILGNISTVDPEKIKFYHNVFKPLIAGILDGDDGVTTSKLAERYTLIFDKPTTSKKILESYCKPLVDAGILSVEKNPKNESQNLYFESSDVTIHSLDKLKSKLIEASKQDFSFMDSCLDELEKVSMEFRKSPLTFKHDGKDIDLVTLKEILLGNSRFSSKPSGDEN